MNQKKVPPKSKPANRWDERLRAVLKEKGISLRKAAEMAGVANSVLDSWSGGASPTDFMAVKRLADKLGVSFSWLLTGDHEKNETKSTLAELYQEVPYFDGLARIRIDRLIPRKEEDDED